MSADGRDGRDGRPGASGAPGAPGRMGDTGEPGLQGIQGVAGRSAPPVDPGAVTPTPMWAKVLAILFAFAMVVVYIAFTSRIVPEVKINREYGKCIIALLLEHRSDNSEEFLKVSSEEVCDNLYQELLKEQR